MLHYKSTYVLFFPCPADGGSAAGMSFPLHCSESVRFHCFPSLLDTGVKKNIHTKIKRKIKRFVITMEGSCSSNPGNPHRLINTVVLIILGFPPSG